jgi:hypothetical protein
MARNNRQSVEDGRRVPKRSRDITDSLKSGVVETEPLRAAVDAAFHNDDIVSESLRANLKARTKAAESVANRVETAFAKFTLSRYSEDERTQPTYLAPGDDLGELLKDAAETGAKALQDADGSRGIRLARGDALNKLIRKSRDAPPSAIGTIKLDDLVKYVSECLAAGTSPLPSLRVCDAGEEAEQLLKRIESGTDGTDSPAPTRAGAATDTAENRRESTRAFVKSKVADLMRTVVPPEAQFNINPPKRADQEAISSNVKGFELRDGPSDVTSYHDFNSLQIAFRHVWTEVFHGELESLGKELYKEYVRLQDFTGAGSRINEVSTVADLNRLIGEIQSLSQLAQDQMPGGSASGRNLDGHDSPAGKGDFLDDVSKALGSQEFQWVANPLGAAIGFLGSLFASMQEITWEFLEQQSRLPGGIDEISVDIAHDALPAGTVEIVVESLPTTATWKGIDFYELDRDGRPVDVVKITNDPRDTNKMQLRTAQVKNGLLAFGKEIEFGAHKAHYFLVRLDEKITDRTRVTFTWEKDK